MPDAPLWVARIPDAIYEIEHSEQQAYGRSDVERMLEVKSRRAQEILVVAGAEKLGKSYLVAKDNLIQYFKVIGREAIEEELRRRRRFSEKLTQERDRFIHDPRLTAGLFDRDVEAIRKRGLQALPDGIVLSPGRIVIEGFTTGEEALRCLMGLALAIAKDQDAFERIVDKDSQK